MIQDDEIRILYLYPYGDDEKAPIVCRIDVASLQDKPEYDCLSYVWGNSDVLMNIIVANEKVGVTRNLYHALYRLRRKDRPRKLWIDQLCINQWDLQEKKQQVQLMRKIYSNCQSCCLWMGEIKEGISPEDAEKALEFIKFMAATADVETNEEKNNVPALDFFHSEEAFRKPMNALETMTYIDNPWWERVWTVQEAVLPKHMELYWGHLTLPWDRVLGASIAWTSYMPPCIDERVADQSCHFLGHFMAMVVWLRIADGDHEQPAWLINRWRFRKATDARDKIYALMGLFEAGQMPTVESCDYDMPAAEVFCGLTFDLMQHYRTLIPLSMDPHIEPDRATANIPRWALDVAHLSDYNTDWYHLFGWYDYNACGGKWLDFDYLKDEFFKDKSQLLLEGVHVDTIEAVGTMVIHHRHEPDIPDEVTIEIIRSWERLAQEHVKQEGKDSEKMYRGGISLREAFGRTLLGNLLRNEEQWVIDDDSGVVTEEHVDSVYRFLETGERCDLHGTIWGMICNQTFFVTKKGLIGLSHRETQVGEQVWVLYGGNVPFTLTQQEGEEHDFDFGSRSYVHGIMHGEVFKQEDEVYEERIIRVH